MIRPLRDDDIPAIRAMFERSELGYNFPDLRGPLMETVLVVTDEQDAPIAAVAFERLLQAYLWLPGSMHPAVKLRIITEMHEAAATELREKGYTETNCFVPPQLEKTFGRRLMRTFGWVRSWPSFARHF